MRAMFLLADGCSLYEPMTRDAAGQTTKGSQRQKPKPVVTEAPRLVADDEAESKALKRSVVLPWA